MNSFFLKSVVIFSLSAASLCASEGAADFLQAATYPSLTAMGNADTALVKGSISLMSNPAGLASGTSCDISGASYRFLGADYTTLMASKRWRQVTLGVGYIHAGLDGFEETTKDTRVTKTGRTFEYSGQAFLLGSALQLTPKWSVGLTLKSLRETAYDLKASGWGADVGTQFRFNRWAQAGLRVTNAMQPEMKWNTASRSSDAVTRLYALGIVFHPFEKWTLSTDFQADSNNNWLKAGLAYKLSPFLTLRAGTNAQEWSTGIGLQLTPVELDFSYTQLTTSDIDSQTRIGVRISL